jgi:Flp pilus assembly pilin Flp
MNRLANLINRFIKEQEGAVVSEYGMLIVVLVLGLVAALAAFRGDLVSWFSSIGSNLSGLTNSST